MFFDHRVFTKVISKHYNPADPITKLAYNDPSLSVKLHFGFVEDNKDPDKKGRLKVRFPQWGDDIVTPWVPYIRPFSGSKIGLWALPEIDDKVVCLFINNNPAKPVVLGSVYHPKIKPKIKDNNKNNLKFFTSKSGSQIILDDTDGEEKISIFMQDGKMRMVLDKNKGLSIVNELGDIKIKCKKLKVQAGDAASIKANKNINIESKNDNIKVSSTKGLDIKAIKDAVFKGNKIKMKGIAVAQNKKVAVKNDLVMGIDMHDIEVPTATGTQTMPSIPHPYIGELNDKLSQDVEIENKAVAVKGSKSKGLGPGHIAMPPGIKFTKQPDNQGEVSSNTIPNVKVNDKEVAVLGSMVKTCSDPTNQETCSIFAFGAAVPLPIMMPGMDPEQFKIDKGTVFNTRDFIRTKPPTVASDVTRSISSVKWNATKAKIGEEITLEANLSNQYEGARVIFKIFADGADPEKDQPIAVKTGNNDGGKASVRWRYYMDIPPLEFQDNGMGDFVKEHLGVDAPLDSIKYMIEDYEAEYNNPLKETAKFFFVAWSIYCGKKESDTIEIGDDYEIAFFKPNGEPLEQVEYSIHSPDGSKNSGNAGSSGKKSEKGVIPGKYQIKIQKKQD